MRSFNSSAGPTSRGSGAPRDVSAGSVGDRSGSKQAAATVCYPPISSIPVRRMAALYVTTTSSKSNSARSGGSRSSSTKNGCLRVDDPGSGTVTIGRGDKAIQYNHGASTFHFSHVGYAPHYGSVFLSCVIPLVYDLADFESPSSSAGGGSSAPNSFLSASGGPAAATAGKSSVVIVYGAGSKDKTNLFCQLVADSADALGRRVSAHHKQQEHQHDSQSTRTKKRTPTSVVPQYSLLDIRKDYWGAVDLLDPYSFAHSRVNSLELQQLARDNKNKTAAGGACVVLPNATHRTIPTRTSKILRTAINSSGNTTFGDDDHDGYSSTTDGTDEDGGEGGRQKTASARNNVWRDLQRYVTSPLKAFYSTEEAQTHARERTIVASLSCDIGSCSDAADSHHQSPSGENAERRRVLHFVLLPDSDAATSKNKIAAELAAVGALCKAGGADGDGETPTLAAAGRSPSAATNTSQQSQQPPLRGEQRHRHVRHQDVKPNLALRIILEDDRMMHDPSAEAAGTADVPSGGGRIGTMLLVCCAAASQDAYATTLGACHLAARFLGPQHKHHYDNHHGSHNGSSMLANSGNAMGSGGATSFHSSSENNNDDRRRVVPLVGSKTNSRPDADRQGKGGHLDVVGDRSFQELEEFEFRRQQKQNSSDRQNVSSGGDPIYLESTVRQIGGDHSYDNADDDEDDGHRLQRQHTLEHSDTANGLPGGISASNQRKDKNTKKNSVRVEAPTAALSPPKPRKHHPFASQTSCSPPSAKASTDPKKSSPSSTSRGRGRQEEDESGFLFAFKRSEAPANPPKLRTSSPRGGRSSQHHSHGGVSPFRAMRSPRMSHPPEVEVSPATTNATGATPPDAAGSSSAVDGSARQLRFDRLGGPESEHQNELTSAAHEGDVRRQHQQSEGSMTAHQAAAAVARIRDQFAAELQRMEDTSADLRRDKVAAAERARFLESQLDRVTSEKRITERSLADEQQQNLDLQEKLITAEEEVAALRDAGNDRGGDTSTATSFVQHQQEAHAREVFDLQTNVELLATGRRQLLDDIQRLQAEIERLQQSILERDGSLKQQAEDIQTLSKQSYTQQSQVSRLERNAVDLEESLAETRRVSAARLEQVQQLTTQLEDAHAQHKHLRDAHNSLADELTNERSVAVDSAQQQQIEFETEKSATESQVRTLASDNRRLQKQVRELEQQASELTSVEEARRVAEKERVDSLIARRVQEATQQVTRELHSERERRHKLETKALEYKLRSADYFEKLTLLQQVTEREAGEFVSLWEAEKERIVAGGGGGGGATQSSSIISPQHP